MTFMKGMGPGKGYGKEKVWLSKTTIDYARLGRCHQTLVECALYLADLHCKMQ